jgi:hypothetical protein
MTCVHLKELYQLCQENSLRFSGSDLVHIVCQECGEQEVCPSVLTDEYEAKSPSEQTDSAERDSVDETEAR